MSSFTLFYSQSTPPFRLSPLQPNQKTIITVTKRAFLMKPALRFLEFAIWQVLSSSSEKNEVLDAKDAALLVNTCITRSLPPVLSLEQGLERIKESVAELRANPPCCSSGMYRFQLAVPPSAKALNWFCSQPDQSNIFPLFFLSNEENPTYNSLSLGRTRGIFGIGSAVVFKDCSPHGAGKDSNIRRYLLAEPTTAKAYGFLDIEFDTYMSAIKHQSGSYYLFIPQIELDEFEDIPFLTATLAWDDSSICTFSEAVRRFELALDQAMHTCANRSQLIRSSLSKYRNAEKHKAMVRANALLLDGKHTAASALGLGDSLSCCSQFVARLSSTLSIADNMIDETNSVNNVIQDLPNINALWAYLIVEECTRLGLTYFCVAPGSRSSPLTIAAASHPLTTCIACIDERSLAFHALGFAKGSGKPAVVITSSGTAVTNLFPAVVEACQSFVPMLLLTADRPPELVDVGANQAIDQIKHYGSFVRHFFSLPPPTDEISAKYVLTTIDSAFLKSTSSPVGPIHINCPFREPLASTSKTWSHKCLSGLDTWISNAEPLTRHSLTCYSNVKEQMVEVVKLVKGANQGILVLGSIQKEDDMWAALLLAKHLLWPIAVDIQSGLRLRKYVSTFLDSKDILFVDQLDQLLLSESVREWMRADVIIQASWETSFLINSEQSLTEPYVARKISEAIRCGSALFYGNSMPIRDADMYGCDWVHCTHSAALMLSSGLPCHPVHVSGNRGASGIDGLISTAIGFAVGCNKRVLLVIGDISFLHDTNGLALLRQRTYRKPMVILVLNNHGGAIFSQLPVANTTDRSILDQFFYTSHNVSIRNLCLAHGVKHVQVQTKRELEDALSTSQKEDVDCVVEVESEIDMNVAIHSKLRNFSRKASDNALNILSKLSVEDSSLENYKIHKMDYFLYRVELNAPPTSASMESKAPTSYREGFVISLTLEDGSSGFGEVAPLEIHKENLLDVEEQLRFLVHAMEGKTISGILPLLSCSISSWIWKNLGIPPGSIFPSVRCGLETALLSAIASKQNSTLLDIISPTTEKTSEKSSAVQICALIDSYGTPMDTALVASNLVDEGFTAIKIKVARRADPDEDIVTIQEVRRKVGKDVVIRVDANRKWNYDEAVKFALSTKDCCLQYIEEPVNDENDIVKFCEETGVPVALDETINSIGENPLEVLGKYSHSGITSVVIKPSVIGGFEKAALVARWAHQLGKTAVISAAYESSLGLSAYVQFAHYLDLQNAEIRSLTSKELEPITVHGLGTYKWFKEDVTLEHLNIHYNPDHRSVEADAVDAGRFLQNFRVNNEVVVRKFVGKQVRKYQVAVDTDGVSFTTNVVETGESIDGSAIVFLHGFLGSKGDWVPIMKSLSTSNRCIAIDLPGHGGSKLQFNGSDLSIDMVVDTLCKVLNNLTPHKVTLVGYSMGARISLYTALKCSHKVEKAVIISGSPGLIDNDAREIRKAKDDFRASTLVSNGLEFFTEAWYGEELWASLRTHPHFKMIVSSRLQHDDLPTLGKVLSGLSIGRQPSLWEDLKHCKVPLQILVGEKDAKFRRIAREMYAKIGHENGSCNYSPPLTEIRNAGHAVHLENPLAVITALRQFI
ncbi:2-succinyl-5-enolpyruvyl-6-hydroxy-3-cyclohexene-1-carboxylate synthase [Striga asiatica]|uniref:2-succinyl-5-enolpyruvyl-6-hydroxy-3-cyclohexene-1-carboxylate synthase n=1 Tax=Striga asiatica TaxID=4170 RepID=A0A5A7PG82_STRAF|nr:2-succinyl-5-enolpyruvyl-6-hydroxy-3-cyclohexene-1-carboxylate synthase [Striga asiatica]